MEPLFDAYVQSLDEWPIAVDAGLAVHHAVEHNGANLVLDEWLGELRQSAAGERCRLILFSSSLISKGKYRWDQLLRPWVAHLAGNLDAPMTTQLLSKAGHVRLEPLGANEARARLDTLMRLWQDGMTAPLPLAPLAGFAWLGKDGTADSGTESAAYAAARQAYESGYQYTGEAQRSAYLTHQWPDFARLYSAQSAHGHTFARLAEALYAPLYAHVKRKQGDQP
jgi:exodeoxyribonuclease V gamma subunit